MANEQQDHKPHGEDIESDQQTMPGKSGHSSISGQGNQRSGGQGKEKQNQNPRDRAKPGMQQRDPSSPGTEDDEEADNNPDPRDDSGSPHHDALNRLQNAPRAAFDRAYVAQTMADHRVALDLIGE